MIGAKVILVDIDKNKPVINIDDLKKKISKKTKAIICVHLNGITCDIEALKKIKHLDKSEYVLRPDFINTLRLIN